MLGHNTVLITGANRGIGLEFARQYQSKGFHVIGTTRKESQELNALNIQVEHLDVSDPKTISTLAKKLSQTPIDILINNAGVLEKDDSTLENLKMDALSHSFAVNATGAIFVTQALLPNLRSGKQKKIINITSELGSIEENTGGYYSYRASKAALNQLTKTMSLDLKSEGFICLALHPGWVKTDMGGSSAPYTTDQSVRSMIQVIDVIDQRANGLYLDLKGSQIPW